MHDNQNFKLETDFTDESREILSCIRRYRFVRVPLQDHAEVFSNDLMVSFRRVRQPADKRTG
jgi:hypothetical protein